MAEDKDDMPIEDRIEEIEAAEKAALEEAEAAIAEAGDPSPEDAVRALQAELEDTRDKLMRTAAEIQNTRRRAEKDVKDAREYAISRFAGDVLNVADNLSRALQAAQAEAMEGAAKTLVDGVELTEKSLLSTLERHGVKKIDPQPGEAFDPNRHQATAQIPSDQPAGRIAASFAPGYVIGERILRAAMVAVSAGGAAADEAPDTSEPGSGVDVKA
ncbi:nucleotide exchange factor GrpE [Hyphobacterium sp. HN65]|uniref:Protein GrpE n=1 Tax=Hyphobacterium lacteum TaxID=3116575 RepID=A0ABU7LRX1_9PROT|nr:nucleotide exchange factor GrpE [Hyphobacterium sp. HN65]MEE2526661.1 nucleotide exchange factor GrpE [Hyphobacterium sp. HN65]